MLDEHLPVSMCGFVMAILVEEQYGCRMAVYDVCRMYSYSCDFVDPMINGVLAVLLNKPWNGSAGYEENPPQ